jgi:phosphohistidine phosphatase
MGKGKAERKAEAALPRELLVLRHGKSDRDARARRDFDRPLAKRGRKDARCMGAWIRKEKALPDLVVCSTARRAKETAERALEEMGLDEGDVKWEPRVYEATLERLLQILGELPGAARRVLLVGHNPSLEDLVLHLGGDGVENPDDGKVLPTCGLALLRMPADWGRLKPGAGDLVELLRPRDID